MMEVVRSTVRLNCGGREGREGREVCVGGKCRCGQIAETVVWGWG